MSSIIPSHILHQQSATNAWEVLTARYRQHQHPVQVLVGPDTDSIAALHILLALLRQVRVLFDVLPVTSYAEVLTLVNTAHVDMGFEDPYTPPGYTSVDEMLTGMAPNLTAEAEAAEFAKMNAPEAQQGEQRFFLCLGLGASVPLAPLFRYYEHCSVMVVDACRPVHLHTLSRIAPLEAGKLFMWGIGDMAKAADRYLQAQYKTWQYEAKRAARRLKKQQAARRQQKKQQLQRKKKRQRDADDNDEVSGGEVEEEDGEEDNNDEEQEDGDDDRNSDLDFLESSASESEEDDAGDGAAGSARRLVWQADLAAVPPPIAAAYYGALAAGRSVALEMRDFAILLNRHEPGFLWLAAVGLTDMYLQRKCSKMAYSREITNLRAAVPRARFAPGGGAGGAAAAGGGVANGGAAAEELVSLQAAHEHSLLTLLRHWSLWSSLLYNPTVQNTMRLLSDDGEKDLSRLLADCGVSIAVSQRPWNQLRPDERQRILAVIPDALAARGCDVSEFTTLTMARSVGYSSPVTAFDACYLCEGLLCAPPPLHAVSKRAAPDAIVPALEACEAPGIAAYHRAQFWKAFDVITASSYKDIFSEALGEATGLRMDIAAASASLLAQRGALTTTATLYHLAISERTTQALESFWTPPRLAALADALTATLAATRAHTESDKHKPLFLACPIPPPVCALTAPMPLLASSSSNGSDPHAAAPLSSAAATTTLYLIAQAHLQRVQQTTPFTPLPVSQHLQTVLKSTNSATKEALEVRRRAGQTVGLPATAPVVGPRGISRRMWVMQGADEAEHVLEAVHLSLAGVLPTH